jgi:hypothetical protein
LADLVERARALAMSGQRHILGITGAPGLAKPRSPRTSSTSSGPTPPCSSPWMAFTSAITL